MAAPVLQSGSIQTIDGTTTSVSIASLALSASGNERILVMLCMTGGSSATTPTVSAVVVDSAGVNSTLANGKVVRQGTVQVAKEGNDYTMVDIFFCLEANLPSSAGNVKLDFTMSAAIGDNLWIAFEITGCPKQEYDNIVNAIVTADVAGNVDMSLAITPNDPDCLIIYAFGANYTGLPFFFANDTEIAQIMISATNGCIASEFTQSGSPAAKTMTVQNSDTTTRHAKRALSFSGVAPSGGAFKSYFANSNHLLT